MFDNENPTISVVIPARDEELYLPKCVAGIREAESLIEGSVELIVVNNRSVDGTARLADELGCKVVPCEAKNLSAVRNTGAAAAGGDYLVTIDADSVPSPKVFQVVQAKLSNPKIVGGGTLMLPSRWSLGIFLSCVCLMPIVLRYGILGGLFYCRKSDFDAIGGFDESLCSAEDIDFAKRLRLHGKRNGRRFSNVYSAPLITSMRKFDTLGDWYFLKHPMVTLKLLRGRNQELANKIWYDFER